MCSAILAEARICFLATIYPCASAHPRERLLSYENEVLYDNKAETHPLPGIRFSALFNFYS